MSKILYDLHCPICTKKIKDTDNYELEDGVQIECPHCGFSAWIEDAKF